MPDPKQKVPLGRTALQVTRLSLGTGYLGGLFEPVTEGRFRATVAEALAWGVNYFDTAPLYGLGESERRLGQALAPLPRDSYVLSTKIGRLLREHVPPGSGWVVDDGYENAWHGVPDRKLVIDFSHDATLASIEESLARLGLDRVDVVYIHDSFTPDQFQTAMRGAYPALERLRSEGTIGALGVGIGVIDMLIRYAREGNFDCFLMPGRYTLLDQEALPELLPLCLQKGIAIVLAGVFNSGILVDPYREGTRFNYRPASPEWVDKARRIDAACRRHAVPLKAAALQFPLAHPAVVTILSGATTREEVEENARLMQVPIPGELWAELRSEGLLPEAAPTP